MFVTEILGQHVPNPAESTSISLRDTSHLEDTAAHTNLPAHCPPVALSDRNSASVQSRDHPCGKVGAGRSLQHRPHCDEERLKHPLRQQASRVLSVDLAVAERRLQTLLLWSCVTPCVNYTWRTSATPARTHFICCPSTIGIVNRINTRSRDNPKYTGVVTHERGS